MSISVVQSAWSSTGGSSATVTLGHNTTSGNCLVVLVGAGTNSSFSVSSIALSGSSDTFSQAAGLLYTPGNNDYALSSIWTDDNCSGGFNTVTVSFSTGLGYMVSVYEVSGLATSSVVDQTSTHGDTGTSWTSGTTGTTSSNNEIWFGASSARSTSAPTLTGPAGWTNNSQSSPNGFVHGYQIVSSIGTATYNGTSNLSDAEGSTTVVTLKAPSPVGGSVLGGTGTFQLSGTQTQKLIVSLASEGGTTSDGFDFPAGVGVYGTGGVFSYSGEAVMDDLVGSMAPQAGTDSAGNAYPPGLMSPQLSLTKNSSPTAQTGLGFLWVDSSGNLWYQSPSGTQTKLALD